MSARRPIGPRVAAATLISAVVAVAGCLALSPAASAATGDITEFPLANATAPFDVAVGPDGNLWTANATSNNVSKVSSAGSVVGTYSMSTAGSSPRAITAGPDGAMWVALSSANKIARVTTDGAVTEFAIPTNNSQPFDIAAGSDGALWFTEFAGNKIGRITTAGAITEYAVPTAASGPFGLTPGPVNSNRLYFTESLKSKVAFITVTGEVTESAPLTAGSLPEGITVVNGSVWFAETGSSKLGRLVNDSTVSEIAVANAPNQVAAGPGDSMWATAGNTVLSMSNQGGLNGTYTFPSANSQPFGLVMGPDGSMWVALRNRNAVARVASGAVPTNSAVPTITPSSGIVPGSALTASTGTWANASSYAYVWQRCATRDTGTCAAVPGATASTYTVTTADDTYYFRVGVTASNGSGDGQTAYSAQVQVGSNAPAPAPAPVGPTATIGGGATAALIAPNSQKRGSAKVYSVHFTPASVPGSVTLTFTKGSKVKTVSGLTIAKGSVSYKWKAPKKWPTGKTIVQAVFAPLAGTAFTQATLQDTVKVK